MSEAFIVRRGGGGAGLNFSVVGGTTQPTGKENLLWVNTSTAITSWGFSTAQPTSPVAGMVWFMTGLTSPAPFNALKKNGLWVYPTGVSQYINGAWESKSAKTYQNGAWLSWNTYLIESSRETSSGAFLATSKRTYYGETHHGYAPTIATPSGDYTVTFSGAGPYEPASGSLITAVDYDLSPFRKLVLNATAKTVVGSEAVYISIFNRDNPQTVQGAYASAKKSISAKGDFTLQIDFPTNIGSYAIALAIESWSSAAATVGINSFYLAT